MAGVVTAGVLSFVLAAACGAQCQQNEDNSLPDAPSVQALASADLLRNSANGSRLSGGLVAEIAPMRELMVGDGPAVPQNNPGTFRIEPVRSAPNFLDRVLNPTRVKRSVNYRPLDSGGLVDRAVYAASRIFVTQNEAGKSTVNTSYFLNVLSMVAAHTAYRPYWNRPVSGPFSDFGSTIGNDAGMNLLHEFGPGLHELVKKQTPRFMTKIQERIVHTQNSRTVLSISYR